MWSRYSVREILDSIYHSYVHICEKSDSHRDFLLHLVFSKELWWSNKRHYGILIGMNLVQYKYDDILILNLKL